MIDMHAHWRPAGLLQSLRERGSIPQIVRNEQGVEVFRTRFGDESLADAFDNAKDYLARMDAHVDAISKGTEAERVWLLEHPALYTAGTSAHEEDLDAITAVAQEHNGGGIAGGRHLPLGEPISDGAGAGHHRLREPK